MENSQAQLQTTNNQLDIKLKQTETDVKTQKDEANRLTRASTENSKQITQQQLELNSIRQQKAQLQNDNDALTANLKNVKVKENSQLFFENKSLNQENIELKQQNSELLAQAGIVGVSEDQSKSGSKPRKNILGYLKLIKIVLN